MSQVVNEYDCGCKDIEDEQIGVLTKPCSSHDTSKGTMTPFKQIDLILNDNQLPDESKLEKIQDLVDEERRREK